VSALTEGRTCWKQEGCFACTAWTRFYCLCYKQLYTTTSNWLYTTCAHNKRACE